MNSLQNRLAGLERRLNQHKSSRNALAAAEGFWLAYRLSGDRELLHKAYHLSATNLSMHFADMRLYILNMLLTIELGNFDRAGDMLDALKPSRNYFKGNEPEIYAWYCFSAALLLYRQGKTRPGDKQYKALLEMANGKAQQSALPRCQMLLGLLDAEIEEEANAAAVLEEAFHQGMRSPALFLAGRACFASGKAFFHKDFFMGVLRWVVQKGIPVEDMLSPYEQEVAQCYDDPAFRPLLRTIYGLCPLPALLSRICTDYMERMDYGPEAFTFYKEAEAKQLELPNLYYMLVKSAYHHNVERVGHYTLERFLSGSAQDRELLAFAYHLVITGEEYLDFYRTYWPAMLEFAAESLRGRQSGRYYNSLYRVYIEAEDVKRDSEIVTLAEKFLYEDLFKIRLAVENGSVQTVWVAQKELKDARQYTMAGKARIIIAAGPDMTCWFTGDGGYAVLQTEYTMVRLVENADMPLYKRFFKKGMVSVELLVALANGYMSYEELPAESLEVFRQAAAKSELSAGYRMMVQAAMGNYYAGIGDYHKAVTYYKGIDENVLNDRDIERMLLAYVYSDDIERAVSLILKKAQCISDRSLFIALKHIAPHKRYHRDMAHVAYELTLKSWYDKGLIDIVFAHYQGSQEEWQELSRAMAAMSAAEQGLDEIILRNALWMHMFDKGAQSAYGRMAASDPGHELVSDFTEYCLYEIIINGVKPEYETIALLEQRLKDTGDRFIAYALCHVYLRHHITTFHSDETIRRAISDSQEDGFIFPILKEVKDKKLLTAYIEENQPFMYRGFPHKQIRLYYRTADRTEWRQKDMRYVRFGLYFAHIPHFYGETITYYVSEEMATGSITTKEQSVANLNARLVRNPADSFSVINNALIYEQMFKYDMVEGIITDKLKEKPRLKSWMM